MCIIKSSDKKLDHRVIFSPEQTSKEGLLTPLIECAEADACVC